MRLNSPPPFLTPGATVYAYLRYSSDNQSIESQASALRAWCAEHRLHLGRVYQDEARSGASVAGRDGFLRLFAELTDPAAPGMASTPAAVVIWSWSRFARDIADAEFYKWSLRHAAVEVWSLTDPIPHGEFAPVFEAFQHVQDSQFLRRLRADTTRGLHDLARQGYSAGGFPPIGYRRGAGVELGRKKSGAVRLGYKWELDPETEPRVRRAWQMRLAGASYREIHRLLCLTPSAQGLSAIFARVTYAGALKCGEVVVWDAHPAYVTRQEFERVQALSKPRRSAHPDTATAYARRAPSPFLLSGILRCGLCGWAMSGGRGGGSPCYRCDWRHRAGDSRKACAQPSLVCYALHEPLLGWLADTAFSPDVLRRERDRIADAFAGDRSDLTARRAEIAAEKRRLALALSRLVDAIERGGYVREIEERASQRRFELAAVERELGELDAALAAGPVDISDDALGLVSDALRASLVDLAGRGDPDLRALVRALVPQAELYADRLLVYYRPFPFALPHRRETVRNIQPPVRGI